MYCGWWATWDCWPLFPTPFKGCALHWGALILWAATPRKHPSTGRAFLGGGWLSVQPPQGGQGDAWASALLLVGSARGG